MPKIDFYPPSVPDSIWCGPADEKQVLEHKQAFEKVGEGFSQLPVHVSAHLPPSRAYLVANGKVITLILK